MINMDVYADAGKIIELCEYIKIPPEAYKQALVYIENGAYKAVAPYFDGLFSKQTAAESCEAIVRHYTGEDGAVADNGFGVMAVFLAAALKTREMYGARGVDERIYYDTMSFFNEILGENYIINGGCYSFDRASWYYRQIACIIYKLGTLEFEMKNLAGGEADHFKMPDNTPVLSVHIQTGSVFTRAALDTSYQMARTFFAKYYPDFKFEKIVCSSWLLSPALKELLAEGSRILLFQSDYEIVNVHADSDSYFIYVFNSTDKNINADLLPEDTSLRRAIKKRLLNGGKIGTGSGVLKY